MRFFLRFPVCFSIYCRHLTAGCSSSSSRVPGRAYLFITFAALVVATTTTPRRRPFRFSGARCPSRPFVRLKIGRHPFHVLQVPPAPRPHLLPPARRRGLQRVQHLRATRRARGRSFWRGGCFAVGCNLQSGGGGGKSAASGQVGHAPSKSFFWFAGKLRLDTWSSATGHSDKISPSFERPSSCRPSACVEKHECHKRSGYW